MTVTIQLPPEIEQELVATAESRGVSVDNLVEALVRQYASGFPLLAPTRPSGLSPEEWVREFRAWVHSHTSDAPLLSDEAISREFIYRDRGL
jgi:hypothetical protein